MVKFQTGYFKCRAGFSYIELMIGMAVLLMGVTFFISMYRHYNYNRITARERVAMATVAQNMAEVYMVSAGSADDAARSEGQSQAQQFSFTVDLTVDAPDAQGLSVVAITAESTYPSNHPLYIVPYVLKFMVGRRNG